MRFIQDLKELGLRVNWCTVRVGWDGVGDYTRLVSTEEIIDFASEYARNNVSEESVIDILVADSSEIEVIRSSLQKLATGCDEELEKRKWRLVLVKRLLKEDLRDPVYGLIKISEFWSRMGYFRGDLHVEQAHSGIPPNLYYTSENLRRIIQVHREWVEMEKARLLDEPAE